MHYVTTPVVVFLLVLLYCFSFLLAKLSEASSCINNVFYLIYKRISLSMYLVSHLCCHYLS